MGTQHIVMRLQKHKSNLVGDKQYFKYVIVVKEKLIQAVGWKEGDELEAEIKGSKLIIEKD